MICQEDFIQLHIKFSLNVLVLPRKTCSRRSWQRMNLCPRWSMAGCVPGRGSSSVSAGRASRCRFDFGGASATGQRGTRLLPSSERLREGDAVVLVELHGHLRQRPPCRVVGGRWPRFPGPGAMRCSVCHGLRKKEPWLCCRAMGPSPQRAGGVAVLRQP